MASYCSLSCLPFAWFDQIRVALAFVTLLWSESYLRIPQLCQSMVSSRRVNEMTDSPNFWIRSEVCPFHQIALRSYSALDYQFSVIASLGCHYNHEDFKKNIVDLISSFEIWQLACKMTLIWSPHSCLLTLGFHCPLKVWTFLMRSWRKYVLFPEHCVF